MVNTILPTDRMTRGGVSIFLPDFFQVFVLLLAEWIVLAYLYLVLCHNTTKNSTWILAAIFQLFFTTVDSIGTLKFRSPSRANQFHPQASTHDVVDRCFRDGQFISYASNRNLSITHHDLFNSSNTFIGQRGWW